MKEIDLIFSGSGAKIPFHVGALQALVETGQYKISRIGGTSGGAIVAATYWAMKREKGLKAMAETKRILFETDFEKIVKQPRFGILIRLLLKLGLYKTKFEKFVDDKIFNGSMLLLPDLHIVTTNLTRQKTEISNYKETPAEKLSLALRKSMSIPFIFTPVIKQDQYYVDGGVTNNYPIDIFNDNERPTIGINLIGKSQTKMKEKAANKPSITDYVRLTLDCMTAEIERMHIGNKQHWDRTIEINTGNASSFDFNLNREEKEKMFIDGYNQAKQQISRKIEPSIISNA